MAEFLSNLWTSVFTPGTTPTLLAATNATFAALQLLLLVLLAATYSIHFLVLSLLCAGLWWAINWFAAELAVAQRPQSEQQEERSRRDIVKSSGSDADDTETETGQANVGRQGSIRKKRESLSAERVGQGGAGIDEEGRGVSSAADVSTGQVASQGAGASLMPGFHEALRRRRESGDRSGEISTDSEWEKVEGERS